MHKSAKGISGIASSVIMTALGVFLNDSTHPHIKTALYVAAGIAALYAALQLSFVHRLLGLQPISTGLPTEAPGASGHNEAGGDVSGLQLSGLANSPVFMGDSALKTLRPPQPPQPSPPKPKPNLVGHKVKTVTPGQNLIYDTSHGEVLYVFPIENRLPGAKAGAVVATLRFSHLFNEHDLIGKSDRAYWYDKYEHEIDLERNETQQVVLGKYKSGRWYYFMNPMRHVPEFRGSHTFYDPPDETVGSFELTAPVIMVAEVFNPYSTDDAYVHRRYLITPTPGGCEVGEAP